MHAQWRSRRRSVSSVAMTPNVWMSGTKKLKNGLGNVNAASTTLVTTHSSFYQPTFILYNWQLFHINFVCFFIGQYCDSCADGWTGADCMTVDHCYAVTLNEICGDFDCINQPNDPDNLYACDCNDNAVSTRALFTTQVHVYFSCTDRILLVAWAELQRGECVCELWIGSRFQRSMRSRRIHLDL